MIPHSPEHYISKTIEYELPLGEDGTAPPASLDFTAVDAWWSNYWEDEKKRKAVMMTIGGALVPASRDKQKMIIVGTDVADGNTGKSVFWRVIRKIFGMLALPLQWEICAICQQEFSWRQRDCIQGVPADLLRRTQKPREI